MIRIIVTIPYLFTNCVSIEMDYYVNTPLILYVGFSVMQEVFTSIDELFRTSDFHPDANYVNFYHLGQEISWLISEVNRYSSTVLNFNQSIHLLSLNDSVIIYNNIIALHNEIEFLFHELENVLSILDHDNGLYINRELPLNYYSRLDSMGEDIRLAGNLLIETLRSLEDAIREADPVFQFLDRLWFE